MLLSPSHTQFSSVYGSTDRRYESQSAIKSGESSKRSKAISKKPKEQTSEAKMKNKRETLEIAKLNQELVEQTQKHEQHTNIDC